MAAAEQLITANLDIWSSAIKAKSAAGRGKSNKLELYGIRKLRELILELAVRGLLVPQDSRDEPASELLKKIAAEKGKLVKAGKIKKPKALPAIEDDEKVFELPGGWEWVRLGDVTNYGTSDKADARDVGPETWVLELEDVEKVSSKLLSKVRFSERQFRSSKNVFNSGDVVYGKLRPYLDKVIVADEDGVCTTEMIPVRGYACLIPSFLRLAMKSPSFIAYANDSTHGMNLPRMGTAKARLALIPLLSKAEQHRIVAKVDELMALCDQLEQQQESSITAHQILVQTLLDALTTASERDGFTTAWTRIADHFDTLFTTEWSIDQLKQTILQLAVMGKLVPQDYNDEPASELLKKIAAEKVKLVKDGKIRKQKVLPKIEEDEKLFELPEGWGWARLGDVGIVASSSRVHKKEWQDDGVPFYRAREIVKLSKFGFVDNELYITEELFEQHSENGLVPECGDVMMTGVGTIGVPYVVPENASFYFKDASVLIFKNYWNIFPPFLHYFMKSPFWNDAIHEGSMGTTVHTLTITRANIALIPIPPLFEQTRIVAKVDELMALCDTLKARINIAKTTQSKLADAMSRQALV